MSVESPQKSTIRPWLGGLTVEFLPLLLHRHRDSARHALHCQASIGEGLHMKKLLVASLAVWL
jgi:hypothetical protein